MLGVVDLDRGTGRISPEIFHSYVIACVGCIVVVRRTTTGVPFLSAQCEADDKTRIRVITTTYVITALCAPFLTSPVEVWSYWTQSSCKRRNICFSGRREESIVGLAHSTITGNLDDHIVSAKA